jgi:hypothetical protein
MERQPVAEACIVLRDNGEGVELLLQFSGGYDKASHAHGQALRIVQQLDAEAASVEPLEIIHDDEPQSAEELA